MPPALLIWSTAISATSLVGVPMGAPGPDRAKKAPILMGCFWSAAWAPPATRLIDLVYRHFRHQLGGRADGRPRSRQGEKGPYLDGLLLVRRLGAAGHE